MNFSIQSACPCNPQVPYAKCCKQYHEGIAAPDAQALMRSRYSAYVMGLEEYLLSTWHVDARPAKLKLAEDTDTKWLGLQLKRFVVTAPNQAIVEFVARYKIGGKAERLHEISQFVRQDGRWYYLSGTHQ